MHAARPPVLGKGDLLLLLCALAFVEKSVIWVGDALLGTRDKVQVLSPLQHGYVLIMLPLLLVKKSCCFFFFLFFHGIGPFFIILSFYALVGACCLVVIGSPEHLLRATTVTVFLISIFHVFKWQLSALLCSWPPLLYMWPPSRSHLGPSSSGCPELCSAPAVCFQTYGFSEQQTQGYSP